MTTPKEDLYSPSLPDSPCKTAIKGLVIVIKTQFIAFLLSSINVSFAFQSFKFIPVLNAINKNQELDIRVQKSGSSSKKFPLCLIYP